jgi:hypothetical protein
MLVFDRELTLQEGFEVADQERHNRLVHGVEVSLASGIALFRYLRHVPIVCHLCGCIADRWIASRQCKGRSKPVLNLYGVKLVKTKHGEVQHIVMMTRDHIIPKSKGGVDNVLNLRPACEFCNSRRGSAMTPDEIAFMYAHPELIDQARMKKAAEAAERQNQEMLAARARREERLRGEQHGCVMA